MPISVAFVDDHPILLEGLVNLYSGKSDLEIVARGESAVDALRITEELRPDVIVLDLCVPGDTLGAVELIVRKYRDTRIIVFAAAASTDLAMQALKLGVAGFVLKGSTARDLHEAIRVVHAGATFGTPGAKRAAASTKTSVMPTRAQAHTRLTAREAQIVDHLVKGRTNRQIALSLDISEKTVKHYMTALMQKLDVRNRVEVVRAAQRLDISSEAKVQSRLN